MRPRSCGPNPRLQRTRFRAPLSRKPLGRTKRPRWPLWQGARLALLAVASTALCVAAGRASSGLNIGPLGDVDELSVEPVLIGNPLGLSGETWRPLFAEDPTAHQALRSALAVDVAAHLKAGGLRVVGKSRNALSVGIYGGKKLGGPADLSIFLVQVWVSKGKRPELERTIVSQATDSELAAMLTRATLQIVDDFVALRTRYRESRQQKS